MERAISREFVVFGPRLRDSRRAKRLSQRQVALALTVPPVLVSAWERGRQHPQPDQLAALTALLDIPAQALLIAVEPALVEVSGAAAGIGPRLKALREARGLSLRELGEKLLAAGIASVTKQAVSAWESGRNQLNAEQIVALCRLLGASADELLGLAGDGREQRSGLHRN